MSAPADFSGWVKLANSDDTVSKGQLIFLVRRVTSSAERNDLCSKHYIFADPSAVAMSLHKTLSVPVDHAVPLIDDMRLFCDSTMRPSLRPNTLYASIAVVQATPFDGLRLLLNKENRSQLPLRELCTFGPGSPGAQLTGTVEEMGEAVTWFDGITLLSLITRNMVPAEEERPGGPRVAALSLALERAIIPLLDSLLTEVEMAHILPRLRIYPILVPLLPGYSPTRSKSHYTPPHVIVFYANYDAAFNTFSDKWLPFNLFRAQNSCAMARLIAQATKVDGNQRSGEEHEGRPKRPSKVSFAEKEADESQYQPRYPTLPHSQGYGHGQSHRPTLSESGMFTGFAFPPKSAEEESGLTRPVQNTPAPISAAEVARRSLGNELGSLRRSSRAARPKVFDAFEGDHLVAPGIAAWDPDWLLLLLRSHLTVET